MSKRQGNKKRSNKMIPKKIIISSNSSNVGQARGRQGNIRVGGNGPRISAPVSSSRQQSTLDPQISVRENGTVCRVVHRELIDTVQSTAALFQIFKRYRCNPGSALTFPWLSTMANSWETYKFRKLRFQSIARCATTTNGSVLLSPDYDAQDGQPNTEAQMSQMKGTQEGSPWQDITLALNPKSMNRLFKAHVTMDDSRFATTAQDEKTIDVAQVFIGTDMDSAVKISKLWVDYDVELFTPQPPQLPLGSEGGTLMISQVGGAPTAPGNFFTNAASGTGVQIGQSPVNPLFSVIDHTVTGPSNDLITLLRDWTGNLEFAFNTTANNAFGVGSPPNLFKNGVAIPTNTSSSQMSSANGQTGATFSTIRSLADVALKAGDIIGLSRAGGILTNPAAVAAAYLVLGGNTNALL